METTSQKDSLQSCREKPDPILAFLPEYTAQQLSLAVYLQILAQQFQGLVIPSALFKWEP